MPELPEVETIAQGLTPFLVGRRLTGLEVLSATSLKGQKKQAEARLVGQAICRVWRRAKLLFLDLESRDRVAFHLKMTGRLLIMPGEATVNKATRLVFHLDSGQKLFFDDQRRFGFGAVLTPMDLEHWSFFTTLGPEPLEIGAKAFADRFQGRTGRIKPLLLDQRVIAGIGNIYADESLHRAKIHPTRRVMDLSFDDLRRLHGHVVEVLTQAIGLGGSSFKDYVDGLGRKGSFQDTFAVYGRANQSCIRCRTKLQSTKVGGRTSTFCPCCQPVTPRKPARKTKRA